MVVIGLQRETNWDYVNMTVLQYFCIQGPLPLPCTERVVWSDKCVEELTCFKQDVCK